MDGHLEEASTHVCEEIASHGEDGPGMCLDDERDESRRELGGSDMDSR